MDHQALPSAVRWGQSMSRLRLRSAEDRARKVALDALGQLEASGPLSPVDRGLADRFRLEGFRDHLGSAWLKLQKAGLRPEDGYVLFADVFGAWHHAMEAPWIPEAYAGPLEEFGRAKACADYLIALNQSGRFEVGGPESIDNLDQVQRSLQWLRAMYERCEQEIAAQLAGLPLTQKSKSESGRLGVFLYCLGRIMIKNFGRPLDEVCVHLATIVFNRIDEAVSVDQAKRARRSRK